VELKEQKMTKKRYIFLIVTLFFMTAGSVKAQLSYVIGGDTIPLYKSTHTYQVEMSDVVNEARWDLYEGTYTVADIENGSYVPLVAKSDYQTEISITTEGYAQITITFYAASVDADNPVTYTSGGEYTLTYEETTVDDYKCFSIEVLHINLIEPIDVDVTLLSDISSCPDSSDVFQYNTESFSSAYYKVRLENPDTLMDGSNGYTEQWEFQINISTEGDVVGSNAFVISVSNDQGLSLTDETGLDTRTYSAKVKVPKDDASEIIFTVEYNDILSVSQKIYFSLDGITGAFQEVDADEISGGSGNSVIHVIYAMPDASSIIALD
jgi:hypothetical protein